MATLVLGVAGAAIGSSFGYASLGWSIGSMLGGYLFAPKQPTQYGPRLGDLKVQVSTYGNAIPIVYGSVRVAGNCIWSTPKIETAHVSESGGKGGGGGVTQISYTYSQSFAIAVHDGEITGIRKIWANGKLIYNLSDTATVETIIASNKAAAGIRIYTGSETQMPDALIQAYVGVADTPAYRGTAYVVFENLQLLAEWGQQMPNLEFEVVKAGTIASSISSLGTVPVPGYAMRPALYGKYILVPSKIFSGGNALYIFLTSVDANPLQVSITGLQAPIDIAVAGNWAYVATENLNAIYVVDISNPFAPSAAVVNIGFSATCVAAFGNYAFAANVFPQKIAVLLNQQLQQVFETSYSIARLACNNSYLYVVGSAGLVIYEIGNYSPQSTTVLPAGTAFDVSVVGNTVYALTNAALYVYDCANPRIPVLTNTIAQSGVSMTIADNYIFTATGTSITISDIRTNEVLLTTAHGCYYGTFLDGYLYTVNNSNTLEKFTFRPKVISTTTTTLSSIVSDICTRAGLSAGDIDVTQLTDTVDGYVVQRGTARSWLEPLMQAFYFDAVESDGKIKFVKRGGAATVAIPEADLAAHEYGTQLPDNLITTRKQEMELPVECNVQYMDTSAAYQIGSQASRRLTTDSENKISVNLPISMTGTKGKQIADVLMYEAWTSRMLFDFQTSWKYAHLEPTDVVTVTKGNRTYTLRIVDEDASGGIYRRQAVLEDASIYTQSATAASIIVADDTVSSVPLTDMVLMDIPLLRDQDDGVGFYAAACGYADGWYGAQAFKSNDGGATWTSFGPGFLNEATIGSASTVLGDFHSGNIFDELNSVTVVLTNGTLSSDTETNVLNGARVYLLGNEILQAKNAVLTAPMTYVLTGLLRGRRGTEFGMATHAVGERFVELTSTTTYLFTGTSDEYDLVRKYRGVSFGGFLDDAATVTFTNTAASLMPYSPTHLGGGRNAALDVILTWIRRTRIGGAWNNYADVPLGEASEAYEVEIWDSGYTVLKRTITGISTQTTTYTAAMQTTDFGGTQATVYFKVFQVSAIVGRGFEARGTI